VNVNQAARILSDNSDVAVERILNFAEAALSAAYVAKHRTYPTNDATSEEISRYADVKEAAETIEAFHVIGKP
jgi:hypothetical protein